MVSLKDVISSGFLLDDELVVSAKVRLAPSPQLRHHSVGDRLYYNGTSRTVESGTRLTHGALGVVAGPGEGEYWGEGLQLRFGGGESVSCYLGTLSRERPPPLPDGFASDDTVYFSGNSQEFTSGDRLEFGLRGTVVGPARAVEGLTVLFDGNKGTVQVFLNQLSREPLPSPPSGEYTWPIEGFSKIEETKLSSPTFQAGAFNWCDAALTPNSLGRLEDGMLLGRATPHVSRLYCRRTLLLYPEGYNQQGLSLYLSAAGSATLPEGWARHVSFTLTVKNHLEVVTRSVMKRAQRNGANNQTRVGGY